MSTCRQLPDCFDRTPAILFSFSSYTSSPRGCSIKLDSHSPAGLVFSTAHRRIFMAMLKSLFTNSMRSFSLVEFTDTKSPRTRALYGAKVSSSFHRANAFSRRYPHFFFVHCSSSSLESQREEDFLLFFLHPAMPTPLGFPTCMSILSPGFFITSNESTLHASAVSSEKAFDDMHLNAEHFSGQRLRCDSD